MVEQFAVNEKVAGSSPASGAKSLHIPVQRWTNSFPQPSVLVYKHKP